MTIEFLVAGGVGVLLLVYLTYTLLNAEKF